MSERGLPSSKRMRHDRHFVEKLAARRTRSVGEMVPLDLLEPNPDQPRNVFLDLEDLVTSIERVGVLEPLLVRKADDGFQIISGERRYRAARMAGLEEVPCIVLDVDEARTLEISLIENLQRQDLSPFEEAEGLQALVDRFGYTHDEVSRRIGKSRTTVTEVLSLVDIPTELRERLEGAGIQAKSLLLEIARRDEPAEQRRLVGRVIDEGLTRDDLRALRRGEILPSGAGEAEDARTEGEATDAGDSEAEQHDEEVSSDAGRRSLTYRSGKGITLTLYLNRPGVTVEEIRDTLREAIAELD